MYAGKGVGPKIDIFDVRPLFILRIFKLTSKVKLCNVEPYQKKVLRVSHFFPLTPMPSVLNMKSLPPAPQTSQIFLISCHISLGIRWTRKNSSKKPDGKQKKSKEIRKILDFLLREDGVSVRSPPKIGTSLPPSQSRQISRMKLKGRE